VHSVLSVTIAGNLLSVAACAFLLRFGSSSACPALTGLAGSLALGPKPQSSAGRNKGAEIRRLGGLGRARRQVASSQGVERSILMGSEQLGGSLLVGGILALLSERVGLLLVLLTDFIEPLHVLEEFRASL